MANDTKNKQKNKNTATLQATASPLPERLIKLPRSSNLTPSPLAPDRQSHSMPSTPMRPHILQSQNILLYGSPEIIFYFHGGQVGGEFVDLFVDEGTDFCGRVDEVTRHQAFRDLWADAVEGLEGAFYEAGFGEVGAEDELCGVVLVFFFFLFFRTFVSVLDARDGGGGGGGRVLTTIVKTGGWVCVVGGRRSGFGGLFRWCD